MILFTFLGAGQYNETTYTLEEEGLLSNYSPAAAAKFLNVDSVIAFLTEEAEKKHRAGFEKSLPAGIPLRCIPIPYGKDEGEFWEIFQVLSQEAATAGEQAWDVTHGFRSLPLLTMLTLTFLRSGLGIKPKCVLYSLYERDATTCPMIDLAPMLNLMDWATAADTFNRVGDSRPLAGIVRKIKDDHMREAWISKKQAVDIAPVTNLTARMEDLSAALALIRPELAGKAASRLPGILAEVGDSLSFSPETRPLSLLLPGIERSYVGLAPVDGQPCSVLTAQLNLIGWYVERGYYVQAATLEREWMISWVMTWLGQAIDSTNVTNREDLAFKLGRESTDFTFKNINPLELAEVPDCINILRLWYNLVDVRNDLDHAGMREHPKPPKTIVQTLTETYEKLRLLSMKVE